MVKRNKITIDARMINHSGIGTYIKMLLPFFFQKFEVTLLGDPGQFDQYAGKADIVPFITPIYSVKEQLQYGKHIPSCDLFWSPHYNAPLFHIKAKYRVVTIHDVFHMAFFNTLSLKQKLYAKLMIGRAVKAADKIITVSHFSKAEIIKYTAARADKISVIHNGVSQKPMPYDLKSVSDKYNLPERYILYVGNVKPHKNLKNLVLAYTKLADHLRKQYKMVVVGKIDGFITGDDEVIAMINNNDDLKDNIVFTGFVNDDDMDTIYTHASLFILPSLYEGFGLPPLEAMLNKCPVAVSGQNSLPEVCGDAALYFDPNDPSDISLQIEKILSDVALREDLIARGTERVKLFTWGDSANRHIQLLESLINDKK